MTKAELLKRCSSFELMEWKTLWLIRQEEAEIARQQQRQQTY